MKENSEPNGDLIPVSRNFDLLHDSWLLDYACSFHVTLHKDWFDIYKSVNYGSVLMGNYDSYKVAGI